MNCMSLKLALVGQLALTISIIHHVQLILVINCIHANPRNSKIGRRPEIFRGSQQNRVSNSEEPPRAVKLGLYIGLQWGGGGRLGTSPFHRNFNISLWFNENKKAVISVQSFTKYSIFIVDGRFMYQSGRAGDEAKKRKSPAKSGRVGITATVARE